MRGLGQGFDREAVGKVLAQSLGRAVALPRSSSISASTVSTPTIIRPAPVEETARRQQEGAGRVAVSSVSIFRCDKLVMSRPSSERPCARSCAAHLLGDRQGIERPAQIQQHKTWMDEKHDLTRRAE